MSLLNEDDSSAIQPSQSINESETKLRIRYAKDFLLSLSELEVCKKLPSEFDQSILSEFEEISIQERHKTPGSSTLQGFRRNDYGSSPPTRGDSSNYSRGGHRRWDNRWSDKDGDSQSDLDPDSGKRGFGNQSRRPWQKTEHEGDGLLGSGSFPRPSGFTAGTSAPKGTTNEPCHLNRSTEAYQPPRPFKAMTHSRPNTHDSFNDETFGSNDSTSQDRAEEERKRRASFEIMRKEQQKVLQEKQKSSGSKQRGDGFMDLMLDEVKEEGALEASSDLNSLVQSVPKDDSSKSSNLLQSSKPRPLVPPGFKNTINEKSSTIKSTFSTDKENPKPGIEEINLFAKAQSGTIDNQTNIQLGFPEVHEPVDGEVFELRTNKHPGNEVLNNSSQENTISILGNIFGSGPTVNDGGFTGFLEQKSKTDNLPSPFNVQSSKFAQWFNEDEKTDDLSSSRTNDLLSLIGGGDKAGTQAPKFMSTDTNVSELSYTGFGITKTPSDQTQLFNNFKQDSVLLPPAAAVLTCEDLEQTILSEYSEKSSTVLPPPPVTTWSVSGDENTEVRTVDNHATHHLLSLLQKGPAIDDGPDTNVGLLDNRLTSEKPQDAKQEGGPGQNLSLEALFGTAFMKELQSAQAPVSAQRASTGSARSDISSTIDGIGPDMSHMTNYESNPLSLKQKQPAKSDDPESWSKFDDQRADVGPLEFQFQRGGEIRLPEEESLVIVGDPANTRNPNIEKVLPSDVGFDISEKFAALNSGSRGERFIRGPYDMLEPERLFNNNLHAQASSPQMHNRGPVFHLLDPNNPQNMNSQMRFPEHLMQRDSPLNQQFPSNMPHPFNHPDARVTGFNVPAHHQMLPPQMRMQGNFPPPHVLRDLQRPGNQAPNFMPDHGFPFGHQQTNSGGIGMPLPVPDSGSGSNQHPEAFLRMMEMELRAQSKNVRPVNNTTQGIYGGPELDMGFRYR